MKKLILFILFPFLAFAQKDSIKVSFSEEKVAEFEKTEIISISERMGVKRPVKAALKFGIESAPFMAHNSQGGPFFGYEQKIGKEFSLNLSYRFQETSKMNFDIEPRWYFDMKKRVNEGLQAYNISGKYLSFKYKNGSFIIKNTLLYNFSPYFQSSAYSLNFGQQFGNYLDFSISAGFKNIRESYIDSKGILKNNEQSQKGNTWFLSSNFRLFGGFSFPQFKMKKSNKFEKLSFSYNNFDVNRLLKINLQDVLYIDKFSQYLKVDIAYENRIGKSMFSSNTMFVGKLNNFMFFTQKGTLDSVFNSKTPDVKTKYPIWEKEKINNFYSNIQITQQLRYYIAKQKQMKKGYSGKNFNGFYVGLEAKYIYSNYKNDAFYHGFSGLAIPRNRNSYGVGATFGVQNQFKNKVFFDLGYSFIYTKNNALLFDVFKVGGNNSFNLFGYLRIGLVR